jgi:endo-1,4-beta-mannosidase
MAPLESTKEFVRAEGKQFRIGDREFKFVGFNIRGLAHYGHDPVPNMLKDSTRQQRTSYLAAARDCGSSVIRIFLPHSSVRSDEQLIERLGEVLKNAVEYQQRVIVCLNDHYETSRFQHWSIFDDNQDPLAGYIYKDKHNHDVLSSDFYANHYKGPFCKYVRKVVTTFRDHPAILCWELTNEGGNHPDHNVFIAFCNDVALQIREIDSKHMITAGIIATQVIEFGGDEPERLYKNLDFLTVHSYPDGRGGKVEPDAGLAQSLKKPLILEEVGEYSASADWFRGDMDYWFHQGASGYMGWAFDPEGNGDGDKEFGIPSPGMDYEGVIQVFKDRANSFPAVSPPAHS